MTETKPADAPVLAGEYALGLLDGAELEEARARAAADPDFAREVARWRGRLAPLTDDTGEIVPPETTWNGIDRAIGGGKAANDNLALLHRSVRMWRSAAAVMSAVAAVLALVLLLQPRLSAIPGAPTEQAATPMVAMLGGDSGLKVVASWDPAARQLVLAVPGEMENDPAHSHELWVIPAGGKPRSLGTMGRSKQMHMRLADALAELLRQGATIAISVEPRGGSPTGAPTGPVVASGTLSRA
jgi:anti-sigma-K factor RskA